MVDEAPETWLAKFLAWLRPNSRGGTLLWGIEWPSGRTLLRRGAPR